MAHAPALVSAGLRVHLPERRRQTHTRDVDESLTYEVIAADTVVYLEAGLDGQAHLVGWRDGAVVALRRPDLIRRTVLIGQYCNLSGRGRAVLPGPHGLPIELSQLVNTLLISFLRGLVPGSEWGAVERVINLQAYRGPRFSVGVRSPRPRNTQIGPPRRPETQDREPSAVSPQRAYLHCGLPARLANDSQGEVAALPGPAPYPGARCSTTRRPCTRDRPRLVPYTDWHVLFASYPHLPGS
jgi:pimeloyl-ACP methyl ester carboxylesterase